MTFKKKIGWYKFYWDFSFLATFEHKCSQKVGSIFSITKFFEKVFAFGVFPISQSSIKIPFIFVDKSSFFWVKSALVFNQSCLLSVWDNKQKTQLNELKTKFILRVLAYNILYKNISNVFVKEKVWYLLYTYIVELDHF